MKKGLLLVACATIIMGTTSLAAAADEAEAAKEEFSPYFYAQAGTEYSIENFDHSADNAWGYNLRLGLRLTEMFAVEAQFEHLASKFKDIHMRDGNGNSRGDVEAFNYTANGKVYPIQGRVQPFALFGMGYGSAELRSDHNNQFIARFGLGMDVLITDNVGMALEVDYILGAKEMNAFQQIPISLGVFYNFI